MAKGSSLRFVSLIASLAILIACLIFYSLLLKPAYNEVNQLRGDLASKSELVKDQRRVVEKVKELLDQYPSLSGPRQTISLAIPNREEYPTLITQVNGLAHAAGLILQSLSLATQTFTQAATVAGPSLPVVGIIQMSLETSGSYQSLKNFIQTLETNIRIMDLVSFSINPLSGSGNYNYNLVVNTYYQTLR